MFKRLFCSSIIAAVSLIGAPVFAADTPEDPVQTRRGTLLGVQAQPSSQAKPPSRTPTLPGIPAPASGPNKGPVEAVPLARVSLVPPTVPSAQAPVSLPGPRDSLPPPASAGVDDKEFQILKEIFLFSDPEAQFEILATHPEYRYQLLAKQNDDLREAIKRAETDELTQLRNRHGLRSDMEKMFKSQIGQMAILVIDVDHFKSFNTTYGHNGGDVVLSKIAEKVNSVVREPVFRFHSESSQSAYRDGGDEMKIVLPGSTIEDAITVAKRVQAAIASIKFVDAKRKPPTVSIGIAAGEAKNKKEFYALSFAADEKAEEAKANGRNRFEIWKPELIGLRLCEIYLDPAFREKHPSVFPEAKKD